MSSNGLTEGALDDRVPPVAELQIGAVVIGSFPDAVGKYLGIGGNGERHVSGAGLPEYRVLASEGQDVPRRRFGFGIREHFLHDCDGTLDESGFAPEDAPAASALDHADLAVACR